MEELDLLQQVFIHHRERLEEDEKMGRSRSARIPLKERLKDPATAEAVRKARDVLQGVSDVREDRVAALRKEMETGAFPPDGHSIADRILQDAILNELL